MLSGVAWNAFRDYKFDSMTFENSTRTESDFITKIILLVSNSN